MRHRMKWIMLAVVVVMVSSVWADTTAWDPDGDDLKFKLDFQDNPDANTTMGVDYHYAEDLNLPGLLKDFNTTSHDVWYESGKIGISGDFNNMNDQQPYGAANDCFISLNTSWPEGVPYPYYDWSTDVLNFPAEGDQPPRTWAFWFTEVDYNDPGDNKTTQPGHIRQTYLDDATFIRHENRYDNKVFWDIYLKNGRFTFRNNKGGATMQFSTVQDMNVMGIKPMDWHHAVVVIDRSSSTSSRIYIDGLSRELEYGALPPGPATGNVNDSGNTSPVHIGGNGTKYRLKSWYREGEFDGMLDDIRVYHRALNEVEASILYQSDGTVKPIALWPIPNSEGVKISTDLEWIPAAGSTAQEAFFDPNDRDVNKIGDGTMIKLTNAQMGGLLRINKTYFWHVDSDVVGGPGWKFTTVTGKAAWVEPNDGKQGVPTGRVNLRWSAPDANDFEVYFDGAKVASKGDITIDSDPNKAVSVTIPGKTYEWHVVSYYPYGLSADSDLWTFRAAPYPIVFNTSGGAVLYRYKGEDESIPAYTCKINDGDPPSWRVGSTGSYNSGAGVAVFPFNDFNFSSYYDIIVIPDYYANTSGNNDSAAPPTPMILDVNGYFYFNGTMDISGSDADPGDRNLSPKARCGGHRGPRKEPTPGEATPETAMGYYKIRVEFESRLGDQRGHNFYPPTASSTAGGANSGGAYGAFGLGTSMTAPYKDSGGAGYGGMGGCSGRGWIHGVMTYGYPYGDKEVPIPFGGSAAAWAQTAPGNAGGGGIEIDVRREPNGADGNAKLGPNAKMLSEGGTTPYICQYPAGGGSGGSIKIVADCNVTLSAGALISVNGGDGGDGSEKGNNTGGGGAGGRVAIFYGASGVKGKYTKNGTITANGGEKGVIVGSGTYPAHNGLGLSFAGDNGTIYEVNGLLVSPRKASAITATTAFTQTPWRDKAQNLIYCPNSPTALTLKWYSGYNKTDACDLVYCGTTNPPAVPGDQVGTWVSATRGQHSSTTTKAINPDMTYYVKVRTVGVGFTPVDSNVWAFKTVDWRCQDPNWPGGKFSDTEPNRAGWPAYDDNHDCVINDLDWRPLAADWRIDRGGEEYVMDTGNLEQFVDEWMTCRARVKGASTKKCIGWPITPDFVPPGITPAM